MKILKRGDTWRQVTCPRCTSQLEIEDHDILILPNVSKPERLDALAGCVVCRHMLEPNVPEYLRSEIRKKDQQRADHNYPD